MGGSPATRFIPCVSLRRKAVPHGVANVEQLLPRSKTDLDTDSDADFSTELRSAKHVGFANVHVREYAVTVGDHPCCSMGYPLTLDWQYDEAQTTSVDRYEAQRAPHRTRDQMRTTAAHRMRLVSEESGLSDAELRRATRKLFRARSCSARLSEKMSESFFLSGDVDTQTHTGTSLTASNHAMEHASPCA
jgi:hypothetical protein